MKNIIRTAIVGCGAISDIYLTNMQTRFQNLEVVACCAAHLENALIKAEKYHIRGCTYEDILADESIEMVVILTPAPTHYELIKRGLLAGKHVYTEKAMTVDLVQAKELLRLAKERQLYLGAAPDTFLGAAIQKAKQVIQNGDLGEITSFHIGVNRCMDRATSQFKFLRQPGGGICYDYGVYHLTALVSLLGPIDKVCGTFENRKPIRVNCIESDPEYGQSFTFNNEAQVTGLIRTESGVNGTFSLNGESIRQDLSIFMIYGTKGVLKIPDPNGFGGELLLIKSKSDVTVLDNDLPYSDNSRGIGPSDMADAILFGRCNAANKELAYHVLDIISQIMVSSQEERFVPVESTFDFS